MLITREKGDGELRLFLFKYKVTKDGLLWYVRDERGAASDVRKNS